LGDDVAPEDLEPGASHGLPLGTGLGSREARSSGTNWTAPAHSSPTWASSRKGFLGETWNF
jgi:hypothetical protein